MHAVVRNTLEKIVGISGEKIVAHYSVGIHRRRGWCRTERASARLPVMKKAVLRAAIEMGFIVSSSSCSTRTF